MLVDRQTATVDDAQGTSASLLATTRRPKLETIAGPADQCWSADSLTTQAHETGENPTRTRAFGRA